MSKFIQNVLLVVIGALAGFAASQTTTVAQVAKHETELTVLKDDIKQERLRTDQRIFEISGLVKEVLASNREMTAQSRELIAIIKNQK